MSARFYRDSRQLVDGRPRIVADRDLRPVAQLLQSFDENDVVIEVLQQIARALVRTRDVPDSRKITACPGPARITGSAPAARKRAVSPRFSSLRW